MMKRAPSLAVCLGLLVPLLVARAQSSPPPAAKLLHELEDSGAPQWLSPDGKTLALRNVLVHLYDVATGEVRATVPADPPGAPLHAFYTPDSKLFVVQTDRVRVFDAGDGKLVREFAVGTVAINLYNRVYRPTEVSSYDEASGWTTSVALPGDAQNLEELPALNPSDRVVSPDWKLMLVRAAPDRAAVYDFATGELRYTLKPAAGGPTLPRDALGEFSPDGARVLTTHADNTPRLWDAATGELVADLAPQSAPVYGARFSADGKLVATTSTDGVVKTWDGVTGKPLHTFGVARKEPTYFAAWNPRGTTFVTKSRKWEVDIWDGATGRPVARLDRKAAKEKFDKNLTFLYSPDGKLLLTQARNVDNLISLFSPKPRKRSLVHLWDAADGKLVASVRDPQGRLGAEHERDRYFWTPNSRFVVIAGWTINLWRADGTHAQELEGNSYLGAQLSRDGTLLVAGHAPTIGVKDVLKVFVGKLPKDVPFITRVWKLEETAVAVSAR